MGQYKHHVFICTSDGTCPAQGSVAVHGAERMVREHLVGGRVVSQYLYHAPPGDNKEVE